MMSYDYSHDSLDLEGQTNGPYYSQPSFRTVPKPPTSSLYSSEAPPIHDGFVPAADERLIEFDTFARAQYSRDDEDATIEESTSSEGYTEQTSSVDDLYDDDVDPDYESSLDDEEVGDDDVFEGVIGSNRARGSRGRGRALRGRGRPRTRVSGRGLSRGWKQAYKAKWGDEERPSRGRKGQRRKERKAYARKHPDPGPEYKTLINQAMSLYLAPEPDLEKALDLAQTAANMVPNAYPAHSLMSDIYEKTGNRVGALTALQLAAVFKKDKNLFWSLLEKLEQCHGLLPDSQISERRLFCLNHLLRLQPDDYDLRYEKLLVEISRNHFGGAMASCRYILRERPSDEEVLGQLAQLCDKLIPKGVHSDIDRLNTEKNLKIFDGSFEHFMEVSLPQEAPIDWNLLNTYLRLHQSLEYWPEGLSKLSRFSRWLLERQSESFWDSYDDDREWDVDNTRRNKTKGFLENTYPSSAYGEGIPLNIRARLGIFRLHKGSRHYAEAMVSIVNRKSSHRN
jgi:general transcription factor 3C polypeptide 3 (transcription factor C subunit 4)